MHVITALKIYLWLTVIILGVAAACLYYVGSSNFRLPFGLHVLRCGNKHHVHGVIFGKLVGNLVYYSPEQQEGHIAVFGPSGKGKTSALLIPTLRSWQGTALVVDISGDISTNVDMPNKIVFDPASSDTVPYDVFAAVDAESTDTDKNERLEQLAFLLMPDSPTASDASAFFTSEGRKILTAALICYYHEGWGFTEICEFILSHDWRSLLNDIASHDNAVANMNISSFAGANDQNNAGCKQSADAAVKLFAVNDKVKNALRKVPSYAKSISPATLETNSLFIYIEDAKLKLYAPLLRIITAQCMEYFSQRPPQNKQMILFCLDEFASFGKLEIVEALRKLRKRHIRIMVLTQSLADLDMIYGKDERKAMLNNFAFKVVLGCDDAETQEYFSKMAGDRRQLFPTDEAGRQVTPAIRPAQLARLGNTLIVLSEDGYIRLRKNFYFKR